jgi:hypothetical protein
MNASLTSSRIFCFPRGWMVFALFLSVARASDSLTPSSEMTAVSSKVFNGYTRTKLADGSYRPERYGFAIGAALAPGVTHEMARKAIEPGLIEARSLSPFVLATRVSGGSALPEWAVAVVKDTVDDYVEDGAKLFEQFKA